MQQLEQNYGKKFTMNSLLPWMQIRLTPTDWLVFLLTFLLDQFRIFLINSIFFFQVVCPDCILLVEDFNLFSCPSSNGRKFYISSPKTASTPSTPSVSFPSSIAGSTDRSRDRLRKLMRDIIVGEAAPGTDRSIGNNIIIAILVKLTQYIN